MREKQIEEVAREMCHLSSECKTCKICNERYHGDDDLCYFQCVAKEIVNHGYRKQSEGKWTTEGDMFKEYVCSVCGYSVDSPYQRTPYCPNCGAKMKGSEEE